MKLFSIETNNNFTQKPINIIPDMYFLAEKYHLGSLKKIYSIVKHNKDSYVFKMITNNGTYIARSVKCKDGYSDCRTLSDESMQKLLELQCSILSKVHFENIIKPIINVDNHYTQKKNDNVWMLYPYVEGELFDGQIHPGDIVMKALELNTRFDNLELSNGFYINRELFPVLDYRPTEWKTFVESLTGSYAKIPIPQKYLSVESQQLLKMNRDYLIEVTLDIQNLDDINKTHLNHYDLQHANVLLSNDKIVFLDIEDIYYANRKIALSYTIFKLLRHIVYMRKKTLQEVLDQYLPDILSTLEKNKSIGLASVKDVFLYGMYRLVGELFSICDHFMSKRDGKYLYDLEKKIHHLFEYNLLFLNGAGITIGK